MIQTEVVSHTGLKSGKFNFREASTINVKKNNWLLVIKVNKHRKFYCTIFPILTHYKYVCIYGTPPNRMILRL